LLTPPTGNVKFLKDASVVTYGLALAQANTVGRVRVTVWHLGAGVWDGLEVMWVRVNTCPFSTPACRAGCVSQSGHAALDPRINRARQLKTRFLLQHPAAFMTLLRHELDRARARYGDRLRVRLNTFSDIRWEVVAPWIFTTFSDVTFYDYSKDWSRVLPANYRLTLSASERTSDRSVAAATARGATVAVVFSTGRGKPLPAVWQGVAVIDGDASDNRADDAGGIVVGLRAKGAMRGDTRGMVRAG